MSNPASASTVMAIFSRNAASANVLFRQARCIALQLLNATGLF